MAIFNPNPKRIMAGILSVGIFFMYALPLPVLASEISGITKTGNTYNIEAAKVSGKTGFRHYDKFNLDKGDIANLKFKDNYTKFVNLVNNKITINGIVNTMKGSNFYNGHAIFVSPQGFVLGASGVLNVGALSVLTPSTDKFNEFKNKYDTDDLSNYVVGGSKYKELINDSHGTIDINGKILSKGDVELYADNISIKGSTEGRAGIISGVKDQDVLTEEQVAQTLFDNLVSHNITDTTNFALINGKIKIVANKKSGFADEKGDVKTSIDIQKADIGANEIDISSTSEIDRQERIDLAQAKINVEDSNITGGTVSIIAKATQKKDIDSADIIDDGEWIVNALIDMFGTDTPSIGALWGVAGKAEADVTIKNSTITALNSKTPNNNNSGFSVFIRAEASSETKENANFLTPSLIHFIQEDEAHLAEYFSSDIYNGFEGARSSATVTVDNSTINAKGKYSKNIEISTEATSSLDANNRLLGFILPIGMFALGTKTVSKAIVKDNSVLKTQNGDVNVTAVSSNNNSIVINNHGLFAIKLEDAYIGMILNNTVTTETEAAIISSTVDANNLSVFATNLADSSVDVIMQAVAGTKDEGTGEEVHGNSAVSIVAVLNRSKNDVSAYIKDSENINLKSDALVLAQSLNITSCLPDATVIDRATQLPTTFDARFRNFLRDMHFKYFNINIFNAIKGRTKVAATQAATLEAGGVLDWNETNNTTTAEIINSKVISQNGDVKVNANTVNLLTNSATTDIYSEGTDVHGQAVYGIALTVIYSIQNNTTTADINESTIEANNVDVNATTELPMNQGQLTFGLILPFKICGVGEILFGGNFASEANGKWDISPVYPQAEDGAPGFEATGLATQNIRDIYSDLKPIVRFNGFFNNIAQSSVAGENAAVSGAIVYNEVNNNTIAQIINNSNITIKGAGNLTVNAVNSVMGYNGLGLFDFLIKKINYKIPGQEDREYIPSVDGGRFGLGVNLAWDNYTNNATAKIDNSSVNATNGNVNVDSASEQSYMNILMTGARSKAFGIDGSIHVQNIKGDTISQISNIAEDNKISAKNVSVNSGKAHIRTTAGKVERDEITKMAKWKVQDKSAKGDAKYIREAKDEITNIIAQGAWTSQYEEADNVVQANSQGVAIGAGVNVTNIERTVKAIIDNSKIDADNVTISADTYNQKIDVEVAAAFSGGVTEANAQVQPVQQDADDAQDQEDLDDDNIFGNLFDLDDVDNPAEGVLPAVQRQFSMSLAGAVDVTHDSSTVETGVNQSVINVKDNLTVSANKEAQNINFGGGLGQSKKVGAGAAINYYMQDGSVKSYVNESTVIFSGNTPTLNILANNKNWILNIEIGAGVASNQDAQDLGFEAALGGSAIVNTLKATIESYIDNSTIKTAENTSGKIDTTISAKSEIDTINIAGGGSYMQGGSYGLSAGATFGYNNIKNTMSAYVKDSTLENIKGLKMSADADNDITGFAIAAAIIKGLDGTAFAFAGSVDVDYIHDTISSKVINSTITADNDVEVKAGSNSGNLAVTGTFDFTSAEVGAGAAGDVSVNVYRNNIESGIDKDSKILKGKDIKVSALSTEKSNVVPIGASVATNAPYLAAAANVAVNVVNNTVKAVASGKIGTGDGSNKVNSVTVSALDETTVYTRGATLVYSGEDGQLNIAGTVNVDVILKEITALITDADINAANDVSVTSASINSLGGTKNSEGKYDRDDITSPTYVDTLLEKNSDGEYTGLKTDNPFYNWNMFFDISAAAKANFAGVLIVKVIENELQAEVTNSIIKAKNLSVIANDYSVKNILAGSVPAFGKIAIGGSILYTLDKSNVYALITNGSDIETSSKTDVEAINTKDNIQVVAVAGGSEKADVNISFSRNKNDDITVAKIDRLKSDEKDTDTEVWNAAENIKIKSENIKVNAVNDVNATHVTVTGGGAENIAITVTPFINTYNSTIKSGVANSNITNAAIDIDAHNGMKSRDIILGLAGAGQGVALVGVGLRNYYTDNVKAFIEKSVIDAETKAKNIDLASSSYVNNSNWIISGAGLGEGVAVLCNVLLNDLDSNVESSITNSDIKNANDISLTANKDIKDDILNVTGSLSISGIGGAGEINVIQTTSKGTANAFIKNTSVKKSNSINVEAYNKKDINNTNIGIGGNFKGVTGAMDAIVNDIESTTVAEIDVEGKEIATNNKLNVNAQEVLYLRNKMGVVGIAIIGGSIVGNININNYNSLVNSTVKSANDGKITAGNADIKAATTFAMTNSDVAIDTGIGAIPVTVVATDLGSKLNSIDNDTMTVAGINAALDAENSLQKQITGSDIDLTGEPAEQGGTLASVSGNLTTNNDINIQAKNVIKGYNGDEFSLTNVNAAIQGAAISPVVYTSDIKTLTEAKIDSGIVKSTSGNINLSSENTFKADYTIVKAGITGVAIFEGNFAYLTNHAETGSVVKDATLEAVNININAKSDTQSDISQTYAGVQVADLLDIAKNENENIEKVSAIITGDNVNITTTNDLNIYTTANNYISTTLFKAELRAANIADLMRNYAILSNVSQAIIDADSGEINVGNNLNIATLSPNGVKAEAYLWDINAIDLVSLANPIKSEANLSSVFASGIGKLTYDDSTKTYSNSVAGVSVNTSGATNIYSGIKSFDDDSAINSIAFSRFYGMENLSAFNTTTYTDYAFNNMTNYAMLSSADHKANSVNIKSVSNKNAKTDPTETDPVTICNFGSTDVQTKVTGKNTINVSGKNDIAADTYIELTDVSTAESDYAGVSVDFVGGSDSGFETSVESDSMINIGGEYIANSTSITSDVTRNAKSDSSFTEISIIGDGKTVKVHNLSKGSSTINIDGLNADKDGIRNNSISIESDSINNNIIVTKIFDLGLIFTGSGNVAESAFDTSNIINIKNTNIDIDGDFSLSSSNQNIADSSLDTQGTLGIICIWNEATSENILNASDIINFENSNIAAQNIDIQTSTFAGTKVGKTVEAVVHSVVGAILVSHLTVKNTVTENSEVNLKSTSLTASKDINITTDTSSYIHQEAETKADFGVLTFANNSNKAYITNNNILALDSDSKIVASDTTNINMNTSNDIKVHSYSDSTNIGGDAGANAEIHLTSNKTVDNYGSIEAGNLVNTVFDKTSDNTLEQHAEAYAYGVVDSSDADGGIWYDPNNVLNVGAGADITSGKNVIIDYNFGSIYTRTDNYSETDFLWCIPITDHDVNKDIHVNKGLQKMTLNGIVKAGQGSQRYLKINRDGTVEESIGFYAGDYEIVDATIISGDEIKEQLINKYTNERTRLEGIKEKDETKRGEYITQKEANDETIETISEAIEPWKDTPISTESELMASLANLPLPEEYDHIMEGMVEYSSVASYFKSDIYTASGLNFTGDQKWALSQDPNSQIYKDAFNALTKDKQIAFRSSYRDFTDSLTFDGYIDSKTDLDPALKTNLKNAHKTFVDNTNYVDMYDKPKAFLAYTNDGYKCIVSNDKTKNPITPYQNKIIELNDENAVLAEDITSIERALTLLTMEIFNYNVKIRETEQKTFPDEVIEKAAYYFKNIDSVTDSRIEVKGIANTKIEGTGNFIGATAGLKIDNYSSYDLIFKDIDMQTFGNGLFIDNKDYTSYMDKPQSVNKDGVETEGVHYKSDKEIPTERVITGITINNFYDNNHPFADTFDIPNPTVASHIIINGILKSNDSLYIWNESGFIEIKSPNYSVPNDVNLLSTNGSVYIDINNSFLDTKFNLKPDNLIFAASGVTIKADEVDIKGNIKSGYSDRKITITDDMLNNLVYDPASDETNLINLGGNPVSSYLNDPTQYGNLKAIYKDNTIYLYSIPDHGLDSSIKITKSDDTPSSGSITGKLTVANGYKNIEITNNTNKNMVIKNINNVKISGTIKAENIEAAEETKTVVSKGSAVTTILSDGNLTLNGVINNNVIRGLLTGEYKYLPDNTEVKGELTISALNNANILVTRQVESGNINDSIFVGGNIDILTDKGAMDILGNITSKYGDTLIQTTDIADINNMTITAAIKNTQGNTMIINNGAGKLQLAGSITNQDGSTSVINNSSHFIYTGTISNSGGDTTLSNANGMFHIYGNINNSGGDINIISNGSSTEITHSIINEALSVTDESGDITTTSGSINITANQGHFRVLDSVDSKGELVPTVIKNTSYDDNKGITITHSAATGVIQFDGDIISTDKGSISIINNSCDNTEINGKINASDGNIAITNNYTGSSDNRGNTNINGTIETVTGDVSITNNNRGNVTVSAIKVSEGAVNIETTNSRNTLIKGNIENKVGGDITIYQENSGMINVISDIYQTDGLVSIKSKNSGYEEHSVIPGGYLIRNIAIQLAPQSSITSKEGNIIIYNDGVSDIYQYGALLAFNGSATVTNTEGNVYSYGDIITGGDITIANHEGNLIMDALYGTTDGNIGILNLHGNLIIDDNAIIMNLSNPEKNKGITIVNYDNDDVKGMYIDGYVFNNSGGDITITNQGREGAFIGGVIESENGDIRITNYTKVLECTGEVTANKGDISIRNVSDMKLDITTVATINSKEGDIKISNIGAEGMDVQGLVKADKGNIEITNENSDLRIGEYNSDNDNYINSVEGNTVINQKGGNILNSITDPANRIHSNYNLGNPNNAYKTLIATGGDLTLNVTDGSIGYTNSTNPGYSVNSPTRDYTDSINVNVSGNITAKAVNSSETSTDKRLINLRAKESDLNIEKIEADGNVMLTAADWKQADTKPTPSDDNYFRGYSILNASNDDAPIVKGQNISIIASDSIGTEIKNIIYEQDTLRAPDSWASFEAENDIYLTTQTNSSNEAKIYQLISKRGSTELDMEADTYIDEITAGGKLKLTQKAQNLTIKKLGYSPNDKRFDDMLYPHDNIAAGGGAVVAPKCAIIKVLDAIDTPERSDSNLKIYSAYVTGNNGDDAHYYPDGSRLADYTLMADNIYANSYKAPDSNVSTKAHPNGYKQTDKTYTDTDGAEGIVHYAEGLNVIGEGGEISIDVLGVDKDYVDTLIPNAQRDNYTIKKHNSNSPNEFKNKYDRLAFYGYDFAADEVVLSVNDYANSDRVVSLDTIYANNAYINTPATNLKVEDGIITNYAEFRNSTKLAVVDNDYRRIVNSDMQLFTPKTGSFYMNMSDSTIMHTTAPVVDFNPYHLVNHYSSENSFVHLTFKETTIQQHNKDEYKELKRKNNYYNKSVSLVFNTLGCSLLPENEIYEISRSGAVVDANNLKVGQGVNVKLQYNDVDIDVEAKVKEIHGDKATVEFLNLSDEISNTLIYEYMKKINAMKNSISSL